MSAIFDYPRFQWMASVRPDARPLAPSEYITEYLAAEQRLGRVRADLAADQMAIVILATLFGLSVVLRDGGAGVDHDALLAAVRLRLTGIEPSPARA